VLRMNDTGADASALAGLARTAAKEHAKADAAIGGGAGSGS
jgi:hypothetical protein